MSVGTERAIRCRVSGRVQGVWYRASTRQQAAELGVTGHARNLDDGTVEVFACGDEDALAALVEWLWQGPPAARVDAVELEDVTPPEPRPREFDTA